MLQSLAPPCLSYTYTNSSLYVRNKNVRLLDSRTSLCFCTIARLAIFIPLRWVLHILLCVEHGPYMLGHQKERINTAAEVGGQKLRA